MPVHGIDHASRFFGQVLHRDFTHDAMFGTREVSKRVVDPDSYTLERVSKVLNVPFNGIAKVSHFVDNQLGQHVIFGGKVLVDGRAAKASLAELEQSFRELL